MDSTGRYVARYEPSDSDHEYLQVAIEMSISDEATLPDMVNFFDSFLKAAGYVYDGSLKIVEDKPKRTFRETAVAASEYWANKEFGDTLISGGRGTDVISFGAAQPAMEFGSRSFDTISIG